MRAATSWGKKIVILRRKYFFFVFHLSLSNDNIYTICPRLDQLQALEGESQPAVRVGLQVGPQGDPVLTLPSAQ